MHTDEEYTDEDFVHACYETLKANASHPRRSFDEMMDYARAIVAKVRAEATAAGHHGPLWYGGHRDLVRSIDPSKLRHRDRDDSPDVISFPKG